MVTINLNPTNKERGELIIDKVDFKLLEEQRLELHKTLAKLPTKGQEAEALMGVLNLLDLVCDKYFFMEKVLADKPSTKHNFSKKELARINKYGQHQFTRGVLNSSVEPVMERVVKFEDWII